MFCHNRSLTVNYVDGAVFDSWYVIGASDYLCRFHIIFVSPCVSTHVFTFDASLFHPHIRIICSPWCIYFKIHMLRYIQNCVLGLFWILMFARDYNCWLYAPSALVLTIGQYAVMILVLIFLCPCNSIHDQISRFRNYWPIVIALHNASPTATMAVPPLWNGSLEVVT